MVGDRDSPQAVLGRHHHVLDAVHLLQHTPAGAGADVREHRQDREPIADPVSRHRREALRGEPSDVLVAPLQAPFPVPVPRLLRQHHAGAQRTLRHQGPVLHRLPAHGCGAQEKRDHAWHGPGGPQPLSHGRRRRRAADGVGGRESGGSEPARSRGVPPIRSPAARDEHAAILHMEADPSTVARAARRWSRSPRDAPWMARRPRWAVILFQAKVRCHPGTCLLQDCPVWRRDGPKNRRREWENAAKVASPCAPGRPEDGSPARVAYRLAAPSR
jgi:hypothetical protein